MGASNPLIAYQAHFASVMPAMKRPASAMKRPAQEEVRPSSASQRRRWPAGSLIARGQVVSSFPKFLSLPEEERCQAGGCEQRRACECDFCGQLVRRHHRARHQPVRNPTWREAGLGQCQACSDAIYAARAADSAAAMRDTA